jgi:predicted permease
MDRFRQDFLVAIRRLRSSPGFTLAAIVTLALGIGANTTVFSAVNALVFRSLAVDRPDELVSVNARMGKNALPVQSYLNYIDFRDRNSVLTGLVAYRPQPANFSMGSGGNNLRMWGYEVSGNYFDVLGVRAARGRMLTPDDDRVRGGHPVAVISWACWQNRFSADPQIAGRTIKLNGMNYTVLGVTPREFVGTEMIYTPEIFVPMAMVAQIEGGENWMDERKSFNLFLLGRRKPGVGTVQAQAALDSIAGDLGREYPKENAGMRIELTPPGLFGNLLRGTIQGFAAVIMGVSGLVLLIACVNLASLLLARAADRRRDTAIRLALGAGRGHLIRQLLTESLILSALGGAAGILLAIWLIDLFAAWKPPVEVPVIPPIAIDWHVLLFAAAASMITGVVFGLAPAFESARVRLAPALKNEAVAERLRSFHPRDALVVVQIAMSVVLMIGSVLVVRSLQNALTLRLGFEPRGASTVGFDLGLQGYGAAKAKEFQHRLLERVQNLPGIESAGVADTIPLTLNWNNDSIYVEGKPEPKASEVPNAGMFRVDPGYWKAAQTRIIAGRAFDEHDREGAPRVAIVNEAFAKQLLPGENPIGKRFRLGNNSGPWLEIIGVTENGKYRSLGEDPMPVVFQSFFQNWTSNTIIVARSQLPESQVVEMLRGAVMAQDPTITLFEDGSFTEQLGLVLLPAKITAVVLGAFGLLAVVLAATGVYGIMAYAVSRRTREIGIRMALGARRGSVLGVVLRRTALLVTTGTVAGVALSLAAGRAFSQILYGISATDPFTYALAIVMMAAIAGLACWAPAMRAISVDPVIALRTE